MSREAFEAWVSDNDEHPRACMKDPDGQYAYPSARNAYFIWQAARAAALEEAAEIVSVQEQYRNAIRTVQRCRNELRRLGVKVPGQTS